MDDLATPLFCRLDGLTPMMRERHRLAAVKNLGLLEAQTVPVFEELTEMAARFIEVPICLLEIAVQDSLWLKSAVGLSRFGTMGDWATSRKISRQEAYSTYVIDSQQPLSIRDTLKQEVFSRSILAQHYGIRSYLGIPLVAAGGECIGVLAALDFAPREFDSRELEFLALTARWGLRELERERQVKTQSFQEKLRLGEAEPAQNHSPAAKSAVARAIHRLELKLLRQLTQELRTPLTTVVGMARVLRGEVLGKLSPKQKEYLDIIYASGQHLNSLVDEILKLDVEREKAEQLQLSPVNLELLCQQAIESLGPVARQKRQELRFSLEPGRQNWLLDREKVRQAMYYLVMSSIEATQQGQEIAIEISRSSDILRIAVGLSELGNGLSWQPLDFSTLTATLALEDDLLCLAPSALLDSRSQADFLMASSLEAAVGRLKALQVPSPQGSEANDYCPPEKLALLLTCYLAESHKGKVMVQGSPDLGCRYALTLPKIPAKEKVPSSISRTPECS